LGRQVSRDSQVLREQAVNQVLQVLVDLKELWERLALLEHPDRMDRQDRLDHLEWRVHKGCLVVRARRGLQELRGHPAAQVQRGWLVLVDHRDLGVPSDHRVHRDRLVHRALLETPDSPDQADRLVL